MKQQVELTEAQIRELKAYYQGELGKAKERVSDIEGLIGSLAAQENAAAKEVKKEAAPKAKAAPKTKPAAASKKEKTPAKRTRAKNLKIDWPAFIRESLQRHGKLSNADLLELAVSELNLDKEALGQGKNAIARHLHKMANVEKSIQKVDVDGQRALLYSI